MAVLPIIIIPPFPTGSGSSQIQLPFKSEIQIGDFIVSRYKTSAWAEHLPWEDWHHAALISHTEPLTIIEAVGPNLSDQSEGPTEILFENSVGFGKSNGKYPFLKTPCILFSFT